MSLVVGITFSAIPAIRATRTDAAETMRATAQAMTGRRFVGTSLAVFQLGAALTLLVGALAARRHAAAPVVRAARLRRGRAVRLLPAAGAVGYGDAESLAYVEEFQRRLRLVPGVQAVTAGPCRAVPRQRLHRRIKSADAHPQARPLDVNYNHVFDSGYFSTLGMPVIRGRASPTAISQAGRRGEARVVMLSEGLARRLFGTSDPIGRAVKFPVPTARISGSRSSASSARRVTGAWCDAEDVVLRAGAAEQRAA